MLDVVLWVTYHYQLLLPSKPTLIGSIEVPGL